MTSRPGTPRPARRTATSRCCSRWRDSTASRTSPGWSSGTAQSDRLREQANLFIVGGHVDPERITATTRNGEQIERMHELIDEHELDGADALGGLHVDRVMVRRALPLRRRPPGRLRPARPVRGVRADGDRGHESAGCRPSPPATADRWRSSSTGCRGFHIDPNHGDEAADTMAGFFERCSEIAGALGQDFARRRSSGSTAATPGSSMPSG